MNNIVAYIVGQWLQVYNVRATQFVAILLGIPLNTSPEYRSVTLCTPSGTFLRTVAITPTTKVADICLHAEQLFLEGDYEIPLESTSLVWTHVTSGGQLTVTQTKFEGIKDRSLFSHIETVNSVSWHPDGTKLASGSDDRTIHIWDMTLDPSKCIATCQGHTYAVRTIQWNPSGTKLASGSDDMTIRIWDTTSWQCLHILQGHTSSLDWHPLKNWVASGGNDCTIRIWDLASANPKCLYVLKGYHTRTLSVRWHPNGTQLASGSRDTEIRIWSIGPRTGTFVDVRINHWGAVYSVSWNMTGTLLASGSGNNTIRIWNAITWKCIQILHGHRNEVRSIRWHPDGTKLASTSLDGTVRIWDTKSWQSVQIHASGLCFWVTSVDWHPFGTYLAGARTTHTIEIWR